MPVVNGTTYDNKTPQVVIKILESARKKRTLLRIFYGTTEEDKSDLGRDWLEENDVLGHIGRSTGSSKIPLLVSPGEDGGPGLLDHCIVRIIKMSSGLVRKKELYRHSRYHQPKCTLREIGPEEMGSGGKPLIESGYTHAVDFGGENHANFKSLHAAACYLAHIL